MKTIIAIAITLMAALTGPVWADPAVTIVESSGRVEVREAGPDWRRAEIGQELPLGATISTGFGASATLRAGNALIDLEQLTRMRIDELLRVAGVERTDLHLEVGRVRANVEAVDDVQPDFNLSSPVSTAAVRGTSFSFDGYSLRVARGRVQLRNRYGRWVTVGEGESSRSDGASDATNPSEEAENTSTTSPYVAGPEGRDTGIDPTVRSASTGSIVIEWSLPLE